MIIPFALFALWLYGSGQGVQSRLSVTFGCANSAATTFTILSLLSVGTLARNWKRSHPSDAMWAGALLPLRFISRAPLALCAFILSFTCILLTASRAGQLAAVCGLLVLVACLLMQGLRRGGANNMALSIGGFITALAFVGGEYALRRFADVGNDFAVREMVLRAHWQSFLDRPLWGTGLNTFHETNAMVSTPENWQALRTTGAVHNIYVQLLEEVGPIDGGLFVLIVMSIVWRVGLRALRSNHSGSDRAAATFAASLAYLFHGAVDFRLQTPAIAALLAGCLGASTLSGQSVEFESARRSNHTITEFWSTSSLCEAPCEPSIHKALPRN